jgi:predicted outer membrane protein
MALKNSSNEDVKKFAQEVITQNHGLSNDLIISNPTGEILEPKTVPSQQNRPKSR